jgi:uncharacterized protein YndB with AHSA1/START domain
VCLLEDSARGVRAWSILGIALFSLGGSGAELRAEPADGNGAEPPLASAPDTRIAVEVEGYLQAPYALVRDVLLDLEGFGRWFPAMKDWRVLSRSETEPTALAYGRQWLPWPVAHRDYVVAYRWTDDESGFVLDAKALAEATPEPRDGVVRIVSMETRWRIEPSEVGTTVHYRFVGDIAGRLPRWAAEAGWRSSTPRLIEALREEVRRRRQQDPRLDGPSRSGQAPRRAPRRSVRPWSARWHRPGTRRCVAPDDRRRVAAPPAGSARFTQP